MDIIETIRKYIESKSSITIQKYCCTEMKDFEHFITDLVGWEVGVHGYLSPHGLVIKFNNDNLLRSAITERIDTSFTIKCCPFCGEKIMYKVIEKNLIKENK